MTEVVSLGSERAARQNDGRAWSPIEMVRDLLKSLESGEIKPDMIYVAMVRHDDGVSTFPYITAGASDIEIVGLLAQHLHFRASP